MKKEQPTQSTLNHRKFSFLNIAIYLFYFILVLTFFFMLDRKNSTGFGLLEIVLSLFVGIFLASILIEIRSLIKVNPLKWTILGIGLIVVFASALFIRFGGPYTIGFASVGALVWILFILLTFLKNKK